MDPTNRTPGTGPEVSPEHINELRLVIREILRAELQMIFSKSNLLSGAHGSVENTILNSISSISKVHEENAIGNKVDAALAKSLDIYRQVNQIEEQLMVKIAKKVMENALGAGAVAAKNLNVIV